MLQRIWLYFFLIFLKALFSLLTSAKDQKMTTTGLSSLSSSPVTLGQKARGREKHTISVLLLLAITSFTSLPSLF